MKARKVIVLGKNGQLAWELSRLADAATDLVCLGRDQVDISNPASLQTAFRQFQPDAVINAAAYTAVDKAESESEQAFLINADAVQFIAETCQQFASHLVHVSTDFVFCGDKGKPYHPDEPYAPLGVYGASKAEGEKRVVEALPNNSCIIRTSWVYSSHGQNFVKTMLRLMKEKTELNVIADQIGTPTFAKGLASTCIEAVKNEVVGIHHWSDAGVASWYDFAIAIQEFGLKLGLLNQEIPIHPITTLDYPTPAKRPSYSVLDKSTLKQAFPNIALKYWRNQLWEMMNELNNSAD